MTLTALILAGTALAGQWRGMRDFDEDRAPASVTISVQPLRLVNAPVLAGTAELRVNEARSVAFTGSRPIGSLTAPMTLGLQIREYIAGDFASGLGVGARAEVTNPDIFQLRSDRTAFGPFVVAKVTLALFTIEARGGPELSITGKGITVAPALDLSAGISF